ncbi:MAG: hypothetical protein M3P18_07595, partial [Actinomycetota bacterium]|nr:hypothetical protein [Actinomycetota bacterium]
MAAQTLREIGGGSPARSRTPAWRTEPRSQVCSLGFHARRWARLIGGLWLFAAGIALMVQAH